MGLLDLTVTQKIIKTVNICFDSAFFRRAWNMCFILHLLSEFFSKCSNQLRNCILSIRSHKYLY